MSSPSIPNVRVAPTEAPARAEAPEPAVLLTGVTRVFGVTPAVVRVDLRIEPGEVLLIRGSNGAGKSTLLAILATLLSPTYGTGRVLGFDLLQERDDIRGRTEFVGHRTRLYEDLSAVENLRFACALFGASLADVPEAIERVGLADTARDRVRGYSQGMRQRVALARAILRRPDLLLLDEPYAALDTEARGLVDDLVSETNRRGGTIVLATHEPTRGGLATRSILMEAGRVLSHGTASP